MDGGGRLRVARPPGRSRDSKHRRSHAGQPDPARTGPDGARPGERRHAARPRHRRAAPVARPGAHRGGHPPLPGLAPRLPAGGRAGPRLRPHPAADHPGGPVPGLRPPARRPRGRRAGRGHGLRASRTGAAADPCGRGPRAPPRSRTSRSGPTAATWPWTSWPSSSAAARPATSATAKPSAATSAAACPAPRTRPHPSRTHADAADRERRLHHRGRHLRCAPRPEARAGASRPRHHGGGSRAEDLRLREPRGVPPALAGVRREPLARRLRARPGSEGRGLAHHGRRGLGPPLGRSDQPLLRGRPAPALALRPRRGLAPRLGRPRAPLRPGRARARGLGRAEPLPGGSPLRALSHAAHAALLQPEDPQGLGGEQRPALREHAPGQEHRGVRRARGLQAVQHLRDLPHGGAVLAGLHLRPAASSEADRPPRRDAGAPAGAP